MSDSSDMTHTNSGVSKMFDLFSPAVLVSTIFVYLLFVYQIGPRWMKNKPAFQLKQFISFYNVAQVATCLYLVNSIWSLNSWKLFHFGSCSSYIPDSPEGKRYEDLLKKVFLVKLFEFTDTVLFVLKKKQNQVTYLHTFHHAAMLLLTYLGAKFGIESGSLGLFGPYINSWVHVIMYGYYFFANIYSAEVMKNFILIKKSITVIQMIQFCFLLIQAGMACVNCKVPVILMIAYIFIVCVIFYGFYHFYKKSYSVNQIKK